MPQEYEIRSSVRLGEPKPGQLYTDADNDLFVYLGDHAEAGWLLITSYGVRVKDIYYPTGPLTEVEPDGYADIISEHGPTERGPHSF